MSDAQSRGRPRANPLFLRDEDLREAIELLFFAYRDFTGEADAVLADRAYLEPIEAENADLVFVGENVLIGGGIGMGLRESDGELREKFDAAIQSMKDDGSLNELIAKWEIGEGF